MDKYEEEVCPQPLIDIYVIRGTYSRKSGLQSVFEIDHGPEI